jgi:hypothetical protein
MLGESVQIHLHTVSRLIREFRLRKKIAGHVIPSSSKSTLTAFPALATRAQMLWENHSTGTKCWPMIVSEIQTTEGVPQNLVPKPTISSITRFTGVRGTPGKTQPTQSTGYFRRYLYSKLRKEFAGLIIPKSSKHSVTPFTVFAVRVRTLGKPSNHILGADQARFITSDYKRSSLGSFTKV